MNKYEEIKRQIDSLPNDEIESFVINRLNQLENETLETTIGQGYTDSYDGYIGSITHYKPMASNDKYKCPDLVYDYNQPYIDLINSIKGKNIHILLIMNEIFHIINNHANLAYSMEFSRGLTYLNAINSNRKLSIKEIFDNDCAFCSERSGLVQNMLKFLGIDSKLVNGYRDEEPHAYNIVYPNGLGNEPMFLFDSSYFVNFNSEEKKYSLGYFYGMNQKKYNELISGNKYKIELSKTESFYRSIYGLDDSFSFEATEPQYIFGLSNNPRIVQDEIEEQWIYNAHFENGIETNSKEL